MFNEDQIITAKQDLFPLTQELDDKLKRAVSIAVKTELENIAKNNFLAYLSHISRTPLNGLLGMLRLLDETELTDKQRQYLESAINAAENLNNAIGEIASFAAKNHSTLEFENDIFDLFKLGHEIVDMFSYKASKKGISYEYVFDEKTPRYVVADSIKLKVVLANLFHNAIEFTEKGKVLFSISSDNYQADNKVAQFRFLIQDTGVGISEEKLENIFDFSDKRIATSDKLIKTSLELAVCKYIIEKAGGSLFLESKKNKGTSAIIKIELPVQRKDTPLQNTVKIVEQNEDEKFSFFNTSIVKEQKEKLRTIKEKILKHRGSSSKTSDNSVEEITVPSPDAGIKNITKALNVLIAEDDPINQSLAIAFVSKLNMNYDTASTGKEALAKFKNGNIDFILMDCEMPEMNGYDATRQIRNLEKDTGKHIPVIAMTAYAMQGDKEKCLHAGMDDYIAKPVTYQALESVVKKYFLR